MTDASSHWQTVAPTSVLEPFGKALLKVNGFDVAVFQHSEQVFALEDRCPHSGASLCGGRVEGGHVQCPAHGLRFRLNDGLMAGAPPNSHATSLGVRNFAVRIHQQDLQLRVDAMGP